MKAPTPFTFDEFFESGLEESVSPFLTKSSKKLGKALPIKSALTAACLLLIAFAFSFYNITVTYLLLSIVYFLVGVPALLQTFEDFKNLSINIDVLMTLSAFLSLAVASPLEGALLLVLFELSGTLAKNVSFKAKSAIYNLNKLAPTKAYVLLDDGSIKARSIKDIEIGQKLLIKAGEVVPLDGKVIEGSSSINLVHLTGESLPILKKVKDEVPAGGLNLDGTITIEVIRTSIDSTIEKISKLITQAQETKPKLQRFFDKFSKIYSSTIILLTFVFAITLPWIFNITYMGIEGSIYRALTFMIAASPCALILATPTAYLSAISSFAKKGIIIKGGVTIDALNQCTTIAFDKTGTLTTGDLSLTSIDSLKSDLSKEQAIAIASALEKNITHPIALAINSYYQKQNPIDVKVKNFKSTAGYGIEGTCSVDNIDFKTYIGIREFIEDKISDKNQLNNTKSDNQTLCFLLINDNLFILRFTDDPRKGIAELISTLKKKLKPIMLTGDNSFNANFIAKQIGITDVYANLRPDDKLSYVTDLSKKGLAMVGDGINDAPSLARATVGISLGKIGSATAIDASDIILLNDDISLLSYLFNKAKLTLKIIRENITLSLLIILIASIPALLGLIPLYVAIILHEGGTVLVGLNSLRLLKN